MACFCEICSEFSWGITCEPFEIFAEERCIGEIEDRANFLNSEGGVSKQKFGFENDI